MNILIGADPEVFVSKDGEFVCAHGMIPGTKKEPHIVDGGAVQVDGFALEFNIEPSDSEDKFIFSIKHVLKQLIDMVPGFEVVPTPVAHFGYDYIKAQPDEAKELGCDPDFNAWEDGREFEKPDCELPFRTGAGHIHIGWGSGFDTKSVEHILSCCILTKQLDFFLGLPSVIFDQDIERRQMYGKAGCFRPKPYGVEYRVLSNKWLSSDTLIRWVYSNTKLAIKNLMDGKNLEKEYGDIQKIINNSDKEAAMSIINAFNIPMPEGY